MLYRKYLVAASLSLGLAALASAAPAPGAASLDNPRFLDVAKLPDLGAAAGKGLAQYRALAADGEGYRDLGLADAAGAKKAVLGKPKREFMIRLDALKAFKAGGDVEALLIDTRIVHYPLEVDGKAVSTVTFHNEKGAWSMIYAGDAQRTSLRKRSIDNSAKRFAKAEEEHFLVRVPALNLEFTAFRDRSDALQLASVSDNPIAGLTAGEAEPAAKVIARLLPMAAEHDGLPN